MNTKAMKLAYSAPLAELILVPRALNLLVSVSMEADFEDWEEGAEL